MKYKQYVSAFLVLGLIPLLSSCGSDDGAGSDSGSDNSINSQLNKPAQTSSPPISHYVNGYANTVTSVTTGSTLNNYNGWRDSSEFNFSKPNDFSFSRSFIRQAYFSFKGISSATLVHYTNSENRGSLFGEGFGNVFEGKNLLKSRLVAESPYYNQANHASSSANYSPASTKPNSTTQVSSGTDSSKNQASSKLASESIEAPNEQPDRVDSQASDPSFANFAPDPTAGFNLGGSDMSSGHNMNFNNSKLTVANQNSQLSPSSNSPSARDPEQDSSSTSTSRANNSNSLQANSNSESSGLAASKPVLASANRASNSSLVKESSDPSGSNDLNSSNGSQQSSRSSRASSHASDDYHRADHNHDNNLNDNYHTRDSNKVSTNSNDIPTIADNEPDVNSQGDANLILPPPVPPVNSNLLKDQGGLALLKPQLNLPAKSFTGKDVKVAIIDCDFSVQGNTNHPPVFTTTPVKINLDDVPGYTGDYKKLQDLAIPEHALIVGSIISSGTLSGKDDNIGLAPGTKLYYAELDSHASKLGRVYLNVYNQSHPAIINNSYYIYYSGATPSSDPSNKIDIFGKDRSTLSNPPLESSSTTDNYYAPVQESESITSSALAKVAGQPVLGYEGVTPPALGIARDGSPKISSSSDPDEAEKAGVTNIGYTTTPSSTNLEATNPNHGDRDSNKNPDPNTGSSSTNDSSTSASGPMNHADSTDFFTTPEERDQLIKDLNNDMEYRSIIAGINFISHQTDAPLFVFATGNYNYRDLTAYLLNENVSITRVVQATRDPNFGVQLDKDTVTHLLLSDPNIKNNIIIVSGGYYDATGYLSEAQTVYKLKVLAQKLGKQLDLEHPDSDQNKQILQGLVDQYNIQLPPKMTEEQAAQGIPYSTTHYVSAIGALQCGVNMYDCITASYKYFVPFINGKTNNKEGGLATGTSFAAPVVSAVAALVKQQFPWFSASNLKTTILTTATDVGPKGIDPIFGWGFINAGNALKGPGMFAFGDFQADMTGAHAAGTQPIGKFYNSYFVNDISGSGGLIVNGTSSDSLFLTGDNTYTGDTVVNSGNLIVTSPVNLGIRNMVINYGTTTQLPKARIVSRTYVNNQGNFVAIDADTGSIKNNGGVTLINANVNGDYTQLKGATLTIDGTSTNYITGTATLAGTLAIQPPKVSNYQFVPTTGKYNVVLQAKNIVGKFDNKISLNPAILKNFEISYSKDHTQVVINQIPVPTAQAASIVSSKDSHTDKSVQAQGSEVVGGIIARANLIVNSQGKPVDSLFADYDNSSDKNGRTTSSGHAVPTTSSGASALAASPELKTAFRSASLVIASRQTSNSLAASNHAAQVSSGQALSQTVSLASSEAPNPTPDKARSSDKSSFSSNPSSSNQALKLSSADKQVLATASLIQNMDKEQLRKLFFTSAGSVYSDAQQATSQVSRQVDEQFAKTASRQFANPRKPILDTARAYVQYHYQHTSWDTDKLHQSLIHGKQTTNGGVFGVYGNFHGINYGLALTQTHSTWKEILQVSKPTQDKTSSSQQTDWDLGKTRVNTTGIVATLGSSNPNYYYSGSLLFNYHSFDLHRTSLSVLDQHGKFSSVDLGLNLQAGYRYYLDNTQGFELGGGLTLQTSHQGKFSETVDSPNQHKQLATPLSFSAKAKNTFSSYGQLSFSYFDNFKLLSLNSQLAAGIQLTQTLADPSYNLELDNGSLADLETANPTFANDRIIQLNLAYDLEFTTNLALRLSGKYAFAQDWHNTTADLSLTYKF